MENTCDRRTAIRTALLAAGFLPFGAEALRADTRADTPAAADDAKLKELRLALLKREMQEKAELFRALIARYGLEVLGVVQEFVIAQTRERCRQASIDKRGLDTIMEILWKPAGDMVQSEVLEKTATTLRLKVTRCIFAEEMRRHGAAETGFAFYCSYDYGFCQGFNPELRFTRTRTLMQGHDCCDHGYELPASGG
jgi:hypothetical protein